MDREKLDIQSVPSMHYLKNHIALILILLGKYCQNSLANLMRGREVEWVDRN